MTCTARECCSPIAPLDCIPVLVSLVLPLQTEHGASEDTVGDEEVLDVEYSSVRRVITTLASAAHHPSLLGCHLAELQCGVFPSSLGEEVAAAAAALVAQGGRGGGGGGSSPFSLGLVLRESDLQRLMRVLRAQVWCGTVPLYHCFPQHITPDYIVCYGACKSRDMPGLITHCDARCTGCAGGEHESNSE